MIRRNSKVPFYYQLYETLRQQIVKGVWRPGELIPSEADLLSQYGLSRATVRQALDMLTVDGLIERHRGRGTFVSSPRIEQTLSRIISFTEDMRQRGLEPGTRVLSTDVIPAAPDIAEMLQVQPGEELATLVRLRLADGESMSIESSHLIHRLCPGLLKFNYARQSLRQTLAQEYDIHLVSARQKIRAVGATRTIAQALSVEIGTALLSIERVSYTDQDVPVEFLRIHHRGDRYTLYNELRS